MSSRQWGLAKSLGFKDRHSIREGPEDGPYVSYDDLVSLSFRIPGGHGLTGKIPGHDWTMVVQCATGCYDATCVLRRHDRLVGHWRLMVLFTTNSLYI